MTVQLKGMEFAKNAISVNNFLSSEDYYTSLIDDLSVRLVAMGDASQPLRQAWIAQVFSRVDTFPFMDDDTSCLSLAFADYDILVVSGHDPRRMQRFIRVNRKITSRKIKLCLMNDAHPRRRAAALMAGFDDVFDTARMQPGEAIARVRAIQRRYDQTLQIEAHTRLEQDKLAKVANPRQLTRRESTILLTLLDSPRHFASYDKLTAILSSTQRAATRNSLKVGISLLRPKLREGVTIHALAGAGYALTVDDISATVVSIF